MTAKTPSLRFPEFCEPWTETTLGDLLTFKNGLNATKEDYGNGEKFINVLDIIQNDFITYDKIIGSVRANEKNKELYKVEYGDVLFQRSSETREEVGQANVYLDMEKPALFGGFVIRGKKNGDYHPVFLNHLLKTSPSRKEITSKSGGSTRYNVGQETLSSSKITTTCFTEQQKIASFLSTVDERIELLEQKKEKLERYKKGMMQQIFPSTSSGQVPKIRFKQEDGADFPKWEEKRISDLFSFKSTNSLSRERLTQDKGKFKNIHYGDIHTKFDTLLDVASTTLPFIKEEVFIKKSMIENAVSEGDLIIADASEDYLDIGKAVEVINLNGVSVLAGLHTIHASRTTPDLATGFGGYLMQSAPVRKQIMRIAQGTKVLSISATRVGELTVTIPDKREQEKIVSLLRTTDKTLVQVAHQIKGLRTWKKGLLQQMFV